MDDAVLMPETKATLSGTGLRLSDIEFVKITPEIEVAALAPFIAAGGPLCTRHVVAAPYDRDHARLSDNLGAIAPEAFARHVHDAAMRFLSRLPQGGRGHCAAQADPRERARSVVDLRDGPKLIRRCRAKAEELKIGRNLLE